MSFDVLDKPV